MNWIDQHCKSISLVAVERARQRQNSLTKPPGSMGQLEEVAIRLAGMLGDRPDFDAPAIVVFAADHGVAAENVSAFPQAVTGEMVRNFANGGAAICVLAKTMEATLEVVNLGTVNNPRPLAGVVDATIAAATENLATVPAMDEQQLGKALDAGRDAVGRAVAAGADMIVGGDMGIANTTAASAMACAYLDVSAARMAGPGTGLDNAGVQHKAAVIERALALHKAGLGDAREVLRRLGGFEIAALCGAMIAAAQQGLPFVVDGFIASSAALAATRINPGCANWLVLSHMSAEPR